MKKTKEAVAAYLVREFTVQQADVLANVITDAYDDLVKTSDFRELKEIVRDLADAQGRTEQRLEALAQAQGRTEQRLESLAQAQERTEQRLESLAQAQERTERRLDALAVSMDELAHAQRRTEEALLLLTKSMSQTRSEVGGLSRSFGYALENEAYRALPTILRDRFQIEVTRRFVRTYVGDYEINLLAEGYQNGEPVLVVGEAKAQLGTDDLSQLDECVAVVRAAQANGELPSYRIVPLWVTHLARPAALRRAEALGILVVQSFEW